MDQDQDKIFPSSPEPAPASNASPSPSPTSSSDIESLDSSLEIHSSTTDQESDDGDGGGEMKIKLIRSRPSPSGPSGPSPTRAGTVIEWVGRDFTANQNDISSNSVLNETGTFDSETEANLLVLDPQSTAAPESEFPVVKPILISSPKKPKKFTVVPLREVQQNQNQRSYKMGQLKEPANNKKSPENEKRFTQPSIKGFFQPRPKAKDEIHQSPILIQKYDPSETKPGPSGLKLQDYQSMIYGPCTSTSCVIKRERCSSGSGSGDEKYPLLNLDDSSKIKPIQKQEPMDMDLNDLKNPGYESKPHVNFKNGFILDYIREEKIKADTLIKLKDGNIGAHRLVLAAVSPFLGKMLIDQADSLLATIIIPDIRLRTMKKIIGLIYTGKMLYKGKEGLKIQAALDLIRLMACTGYQTTKIKPVAAVVLPSSPEAQSSESGENEISMPPTPPESEMSDGTFLTNYTTEIQESESHQKEADESDQPTDNYYRVLQNRNFQCTFCSKTFKTLPKLFVHFEKNHQGATVTPVSDKEMNKITRCDHCSKKYGRAEICHECLKKHGLTRCWVCLETVDRTLLRDHYLMNHVDIRSKDDSRNTYIKCRWCHYLVNIRIHATISNIFNHVKLHLNVYNMKMRKRRFEDGPSSCGEMDDFQEAESDLYECLNVESLIPAKRSKPNDSEEAEPESETDIQLQYKTLKLTDTTVNKFGLALATSTVKLSIPQLWTKNESTGKANINFKKLKLFPEVQELSKEVVETMLGNKN